MILFFCLVIALGSVLLVPMLVGGAAPVAAALPEARAAQAQSVSLNTYDEVKQELGFAPALPRELPEDAVLAAFRVVNGQMLEAEYQVGKEAVLFRTAPGNDDLSGLSAEYAFTQTETVDGIARSYAGVAEKKLNIAVWANEGYSYAVVAEDGLPAAELKIIAESIA